MYVDGCVRPGNGHNSKRWPTFCGEVEFRSGNSVIARL